MLHRRGIGLLLAVGLLALAGCIYIANIPPVADFDVDDQYPNSAQTVSFDAGDSYDPDGVIVSYYWDFDDGQTGSTALFPHAFTVQTDPETFRVTLTVTDDDGGADSDWLDITVNP